MVGPQAPKSALDAIALLAEFGRRVRRVRESRRLSQEQLADIVGIHRTYVGSVERGERNISLLNILRLAAALGVQPVELIPEIPADGKDNLPNSSPGAPDSARVC